MGFTRWKQEVGVESRLKVQVRPHPQKLSNLIIIIIIFVINNIFETSEKIKKQTNVGIDNQGKKKTFLKIKIKIHNC